MLLETPHKLRAPANIPANRKAGVHIPHITTHQRPPAHPSQSLYLGRGRTVAGVVAASAVGIAAGTAMVSRISRRAATSAGEVETGVVMWLGGGSAAVAENRRNLGQYSVGNHENADIIGDWYTDIFWEKSIRFAEEKRVRVVAVDNGTESWIAGTLGGSKAENKDYPMLRFAEMAAVVLVSGLNVLVLSLDDTLDAVDREWPRTIVTAFAARHVVPCAYFPYYMGGRGDIAVVFCHFTNFDAVRAQLGASTDTIRSDRVYEGLLENIQTLRGKALKNMEGNDNGYYERSNYIKGCDFDGIVKRILACLEGSADVGSDGRTGRT